MATADPAPAAQLDAILRADFNPAICTPAKLSAWCAFWGEAQCRPLYQEHCGSNDDAYFAAIETICTDLQRDGSYSYNPIQAARVLRVTLEGVWLDMMTTNTPYSRAEALTTVYACTAAFFPKHFTDEGPVG